MIRNTLIGLVLLTADTATAGVLGIVTQNTAFTSPDSALTGHKGYALSVMTDDGSLISAVDIEINGQLHQRWNIDADTGEIIQTPSGSSLTNGDSHLTPISGALFAVAPNENNTGAGSPLADTALHDYGYGTSLRGVWGVGSPQSTQTPLGYIVVPDGSLPNLSITAKVATAARTYTLRGDKFFSEIPPPMLTPVLRSSPTPGPGTELYLNAFESPANASAYVDLWNDGEGLITINSITLAGPHADKYSLFGLEPTYGSLPTFLDEGRARGSFAVRWQGVGLPVDDYPAQVLVNTSGGNLAFDITALGYPDSPDDNIIPEPSALLIAGLAIAGLALRCRK